MAQGTVTLKTSRLTLRKFNIEDAPEMFENWANDDEVTHYLTWAPHGNVDITKEILQAWIDQYDNPFTYNWAIVLNETNDLIGNISASKYDPKVKAVCVSFCEGKDWWGNEYMPEALRAVISYLVHEENIERVFVSFDKDNENSIKTVEKAEMKKEGVLRKGGFNNQGIVDSIIYSILKDEVTY